MSTYGKAAHGVYCKFNANESNKRHSEYLNASSGIRLVFPQTEKEREVTERAELTVDLCFLPYKQGLTKRQPISFSFTI